MGFTTIPSLYDEIQRLNSLGKIKLYYYPDRPKQIPQDDTDLVLKIVNRVEKLKKDFNIRDLERMILFHSDLIDQANELMKKYGYNYEYTKYDLIDIFEYFKNMQENNPDREYFIDNAYKIIISYFPDLKDSLDNVKSNYKK